MSAVVHLPVSCVGLAVTGRQGKNSAPVYTRQELTHALLVDAGNRAQSQVSCALLFGLLLLLQDKGICV